MMFTRVTTPSWFSMCALSSVFVLALAGPTLAADPHGSAHGSPHGSSSYSGTAHGGHGSGNMHASVHADKHHSKGYPSMGDSPHGKTSGHGGHYSKGKSGHGGGHSGMGHGGQSAKHPGTHQGATEFIDHILKFKDGMSVTADQEKQLRDLKTSYKKDRIKIKANVQLANIDLHELLRDTTSSLDDIERNIKNVYGLKADLNMASIKTKRNAKSVLSQEQQSRMDKIHERIKSHGGGDTPHASGYSRAGKGKGSY